MLMLSAQLMLRAVGRNFLVDATDEGEGKSVGKEQLKTLLWA
jgi:hypothetical protein